MRTVTLYRDDSTVQVVYERVKAVFWTANNTVLVISQYVGSGPEHKYLHWPRERVCWFKDEPHPKDPHHQCPDSPNVQASSTATLKPQDLTLTST